MTTMRTVSQYEAASSLPSLLQGVEEGAVAIEQDGREIAYLISPEEFATTREARRQHLLDASDALSAEIAKNVREKGLSLEDLMRSLDRKAS